MRPFLKWLGGKHRLAATIHDLLPPGKVLVEPFCGSGAIFLTSSFKRYKLNDTNVDLINLYKHLQQHGPEFVEYCRGFFKPKLNNEKQYYVLRKRFNAISDLYEKSAIFLYLNRHGYNGLCRYNAKLGEFNVPFGQYKQPYFPESEMLHFMTKAKQAKFYSLDFLAILKQCNRGDVVYCDPPYVPLSATANFTRYHSKDFALEQQQQLATAAEQLAQRGVSVLISNHYTKTTLELYAAAKLIKVEVNRFVSCKSKSRKKVTEVLALYSAEQHGL